MRDVDLEAIGGIAQPANPPANEYGKQAQKVRPGRSQPSLGSRVLQKRQVQKKQAGPSPTKKTFQQERGKQMELPEEACSAGGEPTYSPVMDTCL